LSASHPVALLERALDRFVARDQISGVSDRQDRTIHHASGEVNGSCFGCDDDRARRCREIDASMTGGVVVDGLLPLSDDDVGLAEGPIPGRRGGDRRRRDERLDDDDRREKDRALS